MEILYNIAENEKQALVRVIAIAQIPKEITNTINYAKITFAIALANTDC